jgi:hypothetical protein
MGVVRLSYATAIVSLLAGCSGASDVSTVPPADSMRVSISRQVLSIPLRYVVVISVDDTADAAGDSLRKNLASAAQLQDQPVAPSSAYCPGTVTDPLHANPIDVRFAVIHPSAAANERLTTPNEVPALARTGDINDSLAYAEWQTAIQTAIRAVPVSSGQYELIGSVQDTAMLLTGQRSARNDKEQLQLASLALSADTAPADRAESVIVNVATNHDDNGSLNVADYGALSRWLLNRDTNPQFVTMNLSAPNDHIFASMADLASVYPRLTDWLRAAPEDISLATVDSMFIYRVWDDPVGLCMSTVPKTLTDGSVACRINLVLPQSESCSAARGQLDPLVDGVTRAPQTVSEYGGLYPVCELRQFDGANLQACLHDVAPAIQELGWCFPDAPPNCSAKCPTTEPVSQHFRFVGGIDSPPTGGILETTCELPE